MNNRIKDIIPGRGLGSLEFGMHRQDVKNMLGIPNEIERYRYTTQLPDETEIWFYEDLNLDVSFSSDDEWKMDTISINSNFYNLWDSIYIGQNLSEAKLALVKKGISNFKYEDLSNPESPDHKLLEIDDKGLNLWFDDDKLNEIQWGPFFKNDNKIDWPYKSNYDKDEIDLGIKVYDSKRIFENLTIYSNNWLDKIFSKSKEYQDLRIEFPISTERENLKTEFRSIDYSIKSKSKPKGIIKGTTRIIHNEHGDIGYIDVEWDNDLNLFDDYLVLETE